MAASTRESGRDERLVLELAHGANYADAGAAVGLSERSVRRRMADLAFRRRVREAAAEQHRRIAGRLDALADHALDALEELLASEVETVRLRAVRVVLESGLRHRESLLADDLAELEGRLDALEERSGRVARW
jgi:hypothetical protein